MPFAIFDNAKSIMTIFTTNLFENKKKKNTKNQNLLQMKK